MRFLRNENMFTKRFAQEYNSLILIAPKLETPKYASTGEWINKLWYINTMKYYSVIKKNRLTLVKNITKLKNIDRKKVHTI